MILLIIKKRDGSFIGEDGDKVEYTYYKAKRKDNDCVIEFGSKDGGHEVNDEVDLEIEKSEKINKKGKAYFAFKEILAK